VALLDTGVYPDHEDLTVRDYLSFCADEADPADKNGHGTNLAGLICSPRNGKGIIGVAPECSLSSAKVLNSSGSGTFEDILRALNWCSNSRVDVVVMSFGVANGTNANIEAKLNQMEESGVIVVTGPRAIDGRPIFPGVCNSVIAVAPPSSQFQSYNHDRYADNKGTPNCANFESVFGDQLSTRRDPEIAILTGDGGEEIAFIAADFCLRSVQHAAPGALSHYGQGMAYDSVVSDIVKKTRLVREQRGEIPILWTMHFPPVSAVPTELALRQYEQVQTAAREVGVDRILAGHLHRTQVFRQNGLTVYSSGSATSVDCDNANAIHLFEFIVDNRSLVEVSKQDFVWRRTAFIPADQDKVEAASL
jgi:hypothetical protein